MSAKVAEDNSKLLNCFCFMQSYPFSWAMYCQNMLNSSSSVLKS